MKKRAAASAILLFVFMGILLSRLGIIAFSKTYSASAGNNSYTLKIASLVPNLYYSDGTKINNNRNSYIAVIRPNPKAVNDLSKLFGETECKEITRELKLGKPVIRFVGKPSEVPSIKTYGVFSSDMSCSQLLNRSSSGLLSFLPDSIGNLRLSFNCDALGRVLSGDTGEVSDESYYSYEGLKLTLDKRIQSITAEACSEMKSGCALVIDVRRGGILAAVSKPDSTFLNKPFLQYNAGSVFKLIIAACALENGTDPLYECNGSITVGDTDYSCQNKKKHKKQHLENALCNSCNCYFVNLAQRLGADRILETINKFGYNGEAELYSGWKVKSACVPDAESLKSKGELSLLSFGQGKLTVSPLSICSAVCAVAGGGIMPHIHLVSAYSDSKKNFYSVDYEDGTRVMSSASAEKLKKYMHSVVLEGTGKNADYFGKTAGKTATAQTGRYENGREILNTWFAGFYPYDRPEYAVVIMVEDGTSGAENCCPIFRTVVEMLDNL